MFVMLLYIWYFYVTVNESIDHFVRPIKTVTTCTGDNDTKQDRLLFVFII